MLEIWAPISGYENRYEVSNTGKVRAMYTSKSKMAQVGQELRPRRHKLGYLDVGLSLNGKSKRHLIHRLVAQEFLTPPETKCEVNHKDGDKGNNHISNLEWVSHSDNMKHSCHSLGNKPNMAEARKARWARKASVQS